MSRISSGLTFSYRQMAGRAGRKGAGRARGEALIMAGNKGEAVRAAALINSGLADVKRCASRIYAWGLMNSARLLRMPLSSIDMLPFVRESHE